MTRNRGRYERVFADTSGDGPHACYFCHELVKRDELHIHHVDHNEENDAPENLAAAHGVCHNSHHMSYTWANNPEKIGTGSGHLGRPHSDETKKTISDKHKATGHAPTMEARSAGGKAPWTDERRANQSKAQSNRSPEWLEKNAAANRGKKRSEESKQRMRESALRRRARERAEREGGGLNGV